MSNREKLLVVIVVLAALCLLVYGLGEIWAVEQGSWEILRP